MVDHNNARIIKTQFFSKVAHDIMDSVVGQLSDGWGENNPANDKWWMFVNVCFEPNGQVALYVSKDSYKHEYSSRYVSNGFAGMSDDDILKKFASWIKKTIMMEFKDDGVVNGWKRDNVEFTTNYLNRDTDITAAQVYLVYELLNGRDCLKKYADEIVKSVLGEAKSEDATKKEEEKRAAKAVLDAKHLENLKTIEEERKQKIAEINKKYDDMRKATYEKWQEAVKQLNGQVA